MSLSYEAIKERLEQIESDLGEKQEPYAEAAEEYYRHLPKWNLEEAKAMLQAEGSTVSEKRANAHAFLARTQNELYHDHMQKQAEYEGHRAAIRVLEARSMIGMALLKAETREQPNVSPQWSGAAA